MTLDSTPDTREVEIFELQHRPLPSAFTSSASEWTPHLFTPTPYDPLSPARIAGDRPKGTRFFEDVQPPNGWEWHSKKWELDLEAGEWVSERLVVGVEYDVLSPTADPGPPSTNTSAGANRSDAGEFGGWVWDLPPRIGEGGRDEEVWLAYGDYELPSSQKKDAKDRKKDKPHKKPQRRDWEESVRYGGAGRTGEWRRRRWVRVVKRREIREQT